MANPKVDYVLNEARKPDKSGHHCHAEGCDAKVPPAMFMCKRHWFKVPTRLRNKIWDLYEPGQEITKDPTNFYVLAALEAIEAVAVKEGRRPSNGGKSE